MDLAQVYGVGNKGGEAVSDNEFIIWVFAYILALFFLTAFGAMYAYDKKKRLPLWLLALWAVFAVPVLFKAWVAVVLS